MVLDNHQFVHSVMLLLTCPKAAAELEPIGFVVPGMSWQRDWGIQQGNATKLMIHRHA